MKKIVFIILAIVLLTGNSFSQSGSKEQLALQYYNSGEYDKAIELYEELYQKNPSNYFYSNLILSCIYANDFKKAERIIKKTISQNSRDLRYLVDLGFVYESANENSKARKQYEEVIQKLPNNYQMINDVAQQFVLRSKINYAISTYKKGRELLKSPITYAAEIAQLYEQEGNYASMMNEYILLIEQDLEMLSNVQVYLQHSFATDGSGKKAEAFKEIVLKKSQKAPDIRLYSDLLMWYSLQQKDFEVVQICMQNQAYDIAIQGYKYILDKGEHNPYYTECKVGILDAKFKQLTSDYKLNAKELELLDKEYQQVLTNLGKTPQTVVLMKNLAHIKAFYIHDIDGAIAILQEAIEISGLSKNILADCKLELGDILLFNGKVWDASLLYSQVEKSLKNDVEGSYAKFKNAKLSYYIGEFEWAYSQLNVLRASTTKLIANDAMELSLLIMDNMDQDDSTYTALAVYARADLNLYRNQYEKALQTLDSVRIVAGLSHPLFDEVLYKKAQIKCLQGKFQEAAELLQSLVTMYEYDILGDDALYLLAKIYDEQLKDKAKAMEYYERIFSDHSNSLYATEARKIYRKMRDENKADNFLKGGNPTAQ